MRLGLYTFASALDAIEPDDLRIFVRWPIEHHLPAGQLETVMIIEASERVGRQLVGRITRKERDDR
jgi:hypothetical protein